MTQFSCASASWATSLWSNSAIQWTRPLTKEHMLRLLLLGMLQPTTSSRQAGCALFLKLLYLATAAVMHSAGLNSHVCIAEWCRFTTKTCFVCLELLHDSLMAHEH